MNMCVFSLTAAAFFLSTGAALAQAVALQNCQTATINGKSQVVCDSAASGDTSGRSPVREEVRYQLPPRASDVRPSAGPNFCGRGFRYTADGCRAVQP